MVGTCQASESNWNKLAGITAVIMLTRYLAVSSRIGPHQIRSYGPDILRRH
jgi:hypothetical protein